MASEIQNFFIRLREKINSYINKIFFIKKISDKIIKEKI